MGVGDTSVDDVDVGDVVLYVGGVVDMVTSTPMLGIILLVKVAETIHDNSSV